MSAVVAEPELYKVFLTWGSKLDNGLVEIITRAPIPESARAFPIFRAGVEDPVSGRVVTWWLWDGTKEWKVGKLSLEQKQYPVREFWNDVLLAERLAQHWRPSDR